MEEQRTVDHFTPEDRNLLTTLGVHMEYMRTGMEEVKSVISDRGSIQTRLAQHEEAIISLKQFRFWILGAAAASIGLVQLAIAVWRTAH